MNLKRFMLALASVAMLAAVMASSASAAVEPGGTWHIEVEEGKNVTEFEPESVACRIGKHAGEEKFTLEGALTGFGPIVLTATGIECINATISNNGEGQAVDEGKLKFTGVTIDGEIGTVCSVKEETVTTNNLETELYMHSEKPEIAFDKFAPEEGLANFAVVHIVGPSCAAAGNYAVRGYVYGEASNPTETPSLTQPLIFSEAVDNTAEANGKLRFAGNAAHLTGNVINSLSGANAGKEFWAE